MTEQTPDTPAQGLPAAQVICGFRLETHVPAEPGVQPVVSVHLAVVGLADWDAYLAEQSTDPLDSDYVSVIGPFLMQPPTAEDLVAGMVNALGEVQVKLARRIVRTGDAQPRPLITPPAKQIIVPGRNRLPRQQ